MVPVCFLWTVPPTVETFSSSPLEERAGRLQRLHVLAIKEARVSGRNEVFHAGANSVDAC